MERLDELDVAGRVRSDGRDGLGDRGSQGQAQLRGDGAGRQRILRQIEILEDGGSIETGELVSATELLHRTGEVPGLARIMARLGMEGRESFGEAAAAIEFVLEGLYLIRRLSKDVSDGTTTYRT